MTHPLPSRNWKEDVEHAMGTPTKDTTWELCLLCFYYYCFPHWSNRSPRISFLVGYEDPARLGKQQHFYISYHTSNSAQILDYFLITSINLWPVTKMPLVPKLKLLLPYCPHQRRGKQNSALNFSKYLLAAFFALQIQGVCIMPDMHCGEYREWHLVPFRHFFRLPGSFSLPCEGQRSQQQGWQESKQTRNGEYRSKAMQWHQQPWVHYAKSPVYSPLRACLLPCNPSLQWM